MNIQNFINQIDGCFIITDKNHKYKLINNTAVDWLGFDSSERSVGLSYDDIQAPASESADFFRQMDNLVLEKNKRIFYLGYYGYHDDYRVIQGHKWPFLDTTQEVMCVGTQFHDVTRFDLINKDKLIFMPDFIGCKNNKTTQFCYLFTEADTDDILSERERECLFFSLRRKTAKEIALILSLSHRTIEDYMDNIRSKLNCQSRSELLEKAALKNFDTLLPLKYLKRLWQKRS